MVELLKSSTEDPIVCERCNNYAYPVAECYLFPTSEQKRAWRYYMCPTCESITSVEYNPYSGAEIIKACEYSSMFKLEMLNEFRKRLSERDIKSVW